MSDTILGPYSSYNSFWVNMDNSSWTKWNGFAASDLWAWRQVHDSDNAEAPVVYSLAAGSHTLWVAYREAGTMIDKVVILPEGEAPAGWGDDAGLVMEAEDSTVGSNWQLKTDLPLGDALWSDPDINAANIEIPGAETDSPRVDYVFEAGKTGTHYVWLRGSANPVDVGDSNSGHVGLDGSIPDSGDEIAFPGATVTWFSDSRDGPRATVSLPGAGRQTLGVWMREDGMRIDRVLLTTNSGYNPNNVNSGRGPALSAAASSPLTLDDLEHDAAGNLTFAGKHEYAYDAWNRMVAVTQSYRLANGSIDSGPVISVIEYDALGRRTVKAVQNSADLDCTYHFYYDGQSLVEERDGSDNVLRQNVWGLTYIDELVQTALNDDPDDLTEQDVESHYFAAHDANYNVLGLLQAAGSGNPAVLVERYEYTPYGERQVFKQFDSGDVLATRPNRLSQRFVVSTVAQPYGLNPLGHQGLYHDEETKLVYNRARMLHPRLGRFMQRDPLGYVDGMSVYAAYYALLSAYDPSGTVKFTLLDKTFGPVRFDIYVYWIEFSLDLKIEADVEPFVTQANCPTILPKNIHPTWDVENTKNLLDPTAYYNALEFEAWLGVDSTPPGAFRLRAGVELGVETRGYTPLAKLWNFSEHYGTFFDASSEAQTWVPSYKGLPCACVKLSSEGNVHGRFGRYRVRLLTLQTAFAGAIIVAPSAPVAAPLVAAATSVAGAVTAVINSIQ